MNIKRLLTFGIFGFDPYLGVTIYDTFTDINSTNLTAHTPNKAPIGSEWAALSGVMQITSNRAAWVSGSPEIHTIDAGKADYTISCIVQFSGNSNAGIAFRVEGVNDWWTAVISSTKFYVIKRIPDLTVVTDTNEVHTAGVDYVLEVICSAADIVVKLDGVTKATISDSFNQTVQNVGCS